MAVDYEVLIIGGGPAGISAAMTLGRMSRTVLLCDNGQPRNAPSSHINNLPALDGIAPTEWLTRARQDLRKYETITQARCTVLSVKKTEDGFHAHFDSGRTASFRKVILAYGMKDIPLEVPGFKELWGKSIFHCPFCHGFEIRGAKIGLIANSEMSFHSLPLIHDLTADLIVFTNGPARFTTEQLELLKHNGVLLVEEPLHEFLRDGEKVHGVRLASGEVIPRDAFFFAPPMPLSLKSDIGEKLGCEVNEFGLYKTNEFGATTVPGVFACGDIMRFSTVLLSCAAGVAAGGSAAGELLMEKFKSQTA